MDSLFCYHIVLLFVATIAFCLLWIGFATPGWFVVTVQEAEAANEYTVSAVNRSLFYDILCPQELENCKTCVHDDYQKCIDEMNYPAYTNHMAWLKGLTQDKEEWVAWQVITTIAVVLSVFGFICVIILVCCLLKTMVYRSIAVCGFAFWLLAGLLVWVPVGMVAKLHVDVNDEIDTNIPHDATLHVPYSIVVLAMGGFIALVTALMLLWLTGFCRSRSDRSESDSDSQILSERTKTRTTTVVRDGGYYGPYPYYQPEYQTGYVYRDVPRAKTHTSSTTSDEFYVVDSPHYPGYNGYFGDRYDKQIYDNRNVINPVVKSSA